MQVDRRKLLPRKRFSLLITESPEEFRAFHERIRRDLDPQTEIARICCDDVVNVSWDVMQWRRWKVAILNLAFADALYELLVEKLNERERGQKTVGRLKGWFANDEIKREVSEILEKHGLDESAIEAEAFRQCATELTFIEQLLAGAESRRAKAIQQFAVCRETFAREPIDMTPRERPPLSITRKSSAG